jgi:hypothetical protein
MMRRAAKPPPVQWVLGAGEFSGPGADEIKDMFRRQARLFREAEQQAVAVLAIMEKHAHDAPAAVAQLKGHTEKNGPVTPLALFALVVLAGERGKAQRARNASADRSKQAIEWVRARWHALSPEDRAKGKAAFARDIRPELAREFQQAKGGELRVTDETIAKRWLKGEQG